ncbi:hypothetical protein JOF29_001879 [Kribbella aluminosa]|uniref:Uncharacterized protein n=1 Tax=Kribbella aluminosa TaxID=416017 RepID=A0ABS4UGM4_9ACTN|nr:hypothetical protein [Kribbella aluminosa]
MTPELVRGLVPEVVALEVVRGAVPEAVAPKAARVAVGAAVAVRGAVDVVVPEGVLVATVNTARSGAHHGAVGRQRRPRVWSAVGVAMVIAGVAGWRGTCQSSWSSPSATACGRSACGLFGW